MATTTPAPDATTSERTLAINRAGWDRVAHHFHGGTALPIYGPLAATEETLGLLDPVAGARVLELGCGSGHSLRYLAERGAAELWGLDLSATQIAFAAETLRPHAPLVRLIQSPMEVDPGIPAGHFDLVLSIYGIGWTVDLAATLAHAATYLRPGGLLLFSGEHPGYGCLEYEEGRYTMARPYIAEGAEPHDSWRGVPIVIQKRRLSTFVNAVVKAGLHLERLVECELDLAHAKDAHTDPARWYSVPRAQLMPTTFIIKARKPSGAR